LISQTLASMKIAWTVSEMDASRLAYEKGIALRLNLS
jgi:hypothetical protein